MNPIATSTAGQQSEQRLMFAMLVRRAGAESHENRDQSDRIDRHKYGNECEQELLNHLATDEHR